MGTLIHKSLCILIVGVILMLMLSFTVYRKSYYYKKAKAEIAGVEEK